MSRTQRGCVGCGDLCGTVGIVGGVDSEALERGETHTASDVLVEVADEFDIPAAD